MLTIEGDAKSQHISPHMQNQIKERSLSSWRPGLLAVIFSFLLACATPIFLPLLIPIVAIAFIFVLFAKTRPQITDNNTPETTMTHLPPPEEAHSTAPVKAVGGAAILARLRSQRAVKPLEKKEVLVLYASQTGTAQEIARNIGAEAERRNITSRCSVASMNELGLEKLMTAASQGAVVVLVASSTGDGDAPDNAAKFFAAIRRRSQPENILKGIRFTCLGLGDSNYTRFMYIPRSLRTRFAELGAVPFYEFGEADEVDGIEAIVDKWIEGLWEPLLGTAATSKEAVKRDPGEHVGAAGMPAVPRCRIRMEFLDDREPLDWYATLKKSGENTEASASDPVLAPITAARWLTSPTSGDRKVLHMEIGTGSLRYSPGDSIGIIPENDGSGVEKIIDALGVDGSAVFNVHPLKENGSSQHQELLPHLKCPCTVTSALRRCDITSAPKKSLLTLLAAHCGVLEHKERLLLLAASTPEGRSAYQKEILGDRASLPDLLHTYTSCKPPLDALFDVLPELPARMYSIACAPSESHTASASVAFSLVEYETKRGLRKGVATQWLHKHCAPLLSSEDHQGGDSVPEIPVFVRSGGVFHPPDELDVPLILIGPGTGVAPFIGFLQQRKQSIAKTSSSVAPCWLYFGCRHPDQDYIYKDELRQFKEDGILTELHVAFSRQGPEKTYVQHLMKQHAIELKHMITEGRGRVFVCGDGAQMAKDVHATLVEILGGDQGALSEMSREGRYVRDIWS